MFNMHRNNFEFYSFENGHDCKDMGASYSFFFLNIFCVTHYAKTTEVIWVIPAKVLLIRFWMLLGNEKGQSGHIRDIGWPLIALAIRLCSSSYYFFLNDFCVTCSAKTTEAIWVKFSGHMTCNTNWIRFSHFSKIPFRSRVIPLFVDFSSLVLSARYLSNRLS